ncbi:MFS transporter [Arenibaculum sp.]|jgi:predicted MFS family arabinose efflux permease|uniref:MFS transporter n=1 Tax=Arenibaculum sp. TaxID=2865862 RepID=UPI002E13D2D5|nr:MFS transporter [Arenibaculum sp.]
MVQRIPRRVALLVFVPFALGHFLSYLYRTVNAVISPDLARDLGLGASDLGLLTSTYFLTFAAAQLPIGVALDRYGPRRVQFPLLTLAACGAALFATSESLATVALARALIGLGVAGCLMSAIKAVTQWLPAERVPFATGLLLAVGGLGAMTSTAPLEAMLRITDWRGVFLCLAGATVLVALLILAVSPERPGATKATSFSEQIAAVGQLYSSRGFWRVAFYSLFANATYMAVQALWMAHWLRDVAGFDRTAVGTALLVGTTAMVAGSISLGWLTDRLRVLGFRPVLTCGGGIAAFLCVQLAMIAGDGRGALALAFLFGFFGTATTLNYAIVAQSVPGHLTGRVSTCFNLLIFLLAFAVQWMIGALLDLWSPTAGGHYPPEAYRFVLGIVLALQVPGLLLWLSLRPWQRNAAMPAAVAGAA